MAQSCASAPQIRPVLWLAGEPYYLESLRYTLSNMNFSTGVGGAQRKQGVCAVRVPSADTAWEVRAPRGTVQVMLRMRCVRFEMCFCLGHAGVLIRGRS